MLARFVQLLYVVFFGVKSADKLLNYLMFGQTLIEVIMETLKTHEFHDLHKITLVTIVTNSPALSY